MNSTKEFEPLKLPKRGWAGEVTDVNKYRVYKSPEEFDVVEASSAAEAAAKADIENPFRIVRGAYDFTTIIEGKYLIQNEESYEIPIGFEDQESDTRVTVSRAGEQEPPQQLNPKNISMKPAEEEEQKVVPEEEMTQAKPSTPEQPE